MISYYHKPDKKVLLYKIKEILSENINKVKRNYKI